MLVSVFGFNSQGLHWTGYPDRDPALISPRGHRRSLRLSRKNDDSSSPAGEGRRIGSRVLSCYGVVIIVGVLEPCGIFNGANPHPRHATFAYYPRRNLYTPLLKANYEV